MNNDYKDSKILRSIAKERYFFELERKEKINENLSIPIGLLTLASGLLITFSDFISSYEFEKISILFKICASLYIVLLSMDFYFIIKCFFMQYTYILLPKGWVKQFADLKNHYKNKSIDLDNEIEKDLLGQYSEYAEKNSESNDIKVSYLVRVKFVLSLILIVGFFSLVAQYFDKNSLTEKEQEIGVYILKKE